MTSEKIIVKIEEELVDLAPGYLARRRSEAPKMLELLDKIRSAAADINESLQELRKIAHQISGNAGSYGFHKLSELGAELEDFVVKKNFDAAQIKIEQIQSYLSQVELEMPQG